VRSPIDLQPPSAKQPAEFPAFRYSTDLAECDDENTAASISRIVTIGTPIPAKVYSCRHLIGPQAATSACHFRYRRPEGRKDGSGSQ